MSERIKLATIECAVCSAWIEVFGQYEGDELTLVWSTRDAADLCRQPPLTACPQARAEVKRRYPEAIDT